MKKTSVILLAMMMAVSLVSCGSSENGSSKEQTDNKTVSQNDSDLEKTSEDSKNVSEESIDNIVNTDSLAESEAISEEPEAELETELIRIIPEELSYQSWLTNGSLIFKYPGGDYKIYDTTVGNNKFEAAGNEYVASFLNDQKGVCSINCKVGDTDRFYMIIYLDANENTKKVSNNDEAYEFCKELIAEEIRTAYGVEGGSCELTENSSEQVHLDKVPIYGSIKTEYDYLLVKGIAGVDSESGSKNVHFTGAFGKLDSVSAGSKEINDIPFMLLTFSDSEDELVLEYLNTVITYSMENVKRS